MDHNFDNHPYEFSILTSRVSTIAFAEIVRKRRLQGAVKAVKQGGTLGGNIGNYHYPKP